MGRPKKIKVIDGPVDEHAPEVNTSITFDGQKNAFEALFEGDPEKFPILKSVGYVQIPGTNTFVAYTLFSKGSSILKIECEEPNLRSIAEESAKIFFVTHFMNGDDYAQSQIM